MKKFLSLVLALVMTMSLVTVAGAKDFTDAADIQYEEAVAVLSEVGVVDGYTDGNFNPDVELNRGQAAKIICNLVLGPTTAAALKANVAPFTDVPADHHFAGYIAYCVEQGFVSGYADGSFKPGNKLTGYAFQKMLLCALGYDQEIEGYTGENWSIQVAKQALAIGLTNNLKEAFNGVDYVTREEACLYALNALQATTVEYDAKIIANVGGAQVTVGTSVATDVKWNIAKNTDGNIKDDNYVQFAEKHFPKLELEVGEGIYGRPANTWKTNKKEIGTFTSIAPILVYTEGTEGGDVYKDLGKDVVNEYDWTAYIDGKEVKATLPVKGDDADYIHTGEGTVCEIYVNDDEETVTVVEINYYLGQVTKVKSDDDGEYITVKNLEDGNLNDRTFYVEGYAEDDYVVYTRDYSTADGYVIGEVCAPEVVEAEVTRVETDDNSEITYLKADGEKYIYSAWMAYDVADAAKNAHPDLSEDYKLYLDPNGYVLGYEKITAEATEYLYVLDADEEMDDWRLKVLLADGSVKVVDAKTDLKKTTDEFGYDDIEWLAGEGEDADSYDKGFKANVEGLIWKYTVDDNDVYTLTYVKQAAVDFEEKVGKAEAQFHEDEDVEIHNGKAYVEIGEDELIVDKKTVFVNKEGKCAYTGYDEVPNVEEADIAYVQDKNVGEIVFILSGDIYDTNSLYFYLAKETRESLKYDGDLYWEYSKAYVDGEKQSVIVAYDALSEEAMEEMGFEGEANGRNYLFAGWLYKARKAVDDEYITEVTPIAPIDLFEDVEAITEEGYIGDTYAVGDEAFWITGIEEDTYKFDTDDETKYVFVEVEFKENQRRAVTNQSQYVIDAYNVSVGNLGDMRVEDLDEDEAATIVWVVKEDDNYAELVYIFDLIFPEDAFQGEDEEEIEGIVVVITLEGVEVTVNDEEADATDVAEAITKALNKKGYSDFVVDMAAKQVTGTKNDDLVLPITITEAGAEQAPAEGGEG